MTKTLQKTRLTLTPTPADHLPVDRGRPRNLAHLRLVDQEIEHDRDKGPHKKKEKVVDGERHAEYADCALKETRHGDGSVFGPPDHLDKIAEHEDEGEREQEEHDMFSVVDAAEDAPLHHKAEERDGEGRQKDSHPVPHDPSPEQARNRIGHESPDHVKRPVSDVRNSQDTEDKTEAGSDDEEDYGPAQSHQDLADNPG